MLIRRLETDIYSKKWDWATQLITLWCFYIVGREILTLGEGFNTQVITEWCFYIVGREILTLGEGFNTQVITQWCFYIVGREILTLGEGFNTQVITQWCFYIVSLSQRVTKSWAVAAHCVLAPLSMLGSTW